MTTETTKVYRGQFPQTLQGWGGLLDQKYTSIFNDEYEGSLLAALVANVNEEELRLLAKTLDLVDPLLPMSTIVDFLWYYSWYGGQDRPGLSSFDRQQLSFLSVSELQKSAFSSLPTRASLLFFLFFEVEVPTLPINLTRTLTIEMYPPFLVVLLAKRLYGHTDSSGDVSFYNYLQYVPSQSAIENIIYLGLVDGRMSGLASRYQLGIDSAHPLTPDYFVQEVLASREAILYGDVLLEPFTVLELKKIHRDIVRNILNRYTTVKLVRFYNINGTNIRWSGRDDLMEKIITRYSQPDD